MSQDWNIAEIVLLRRQEQKDTADRIIVHATKIDAIGSDPEASDDAG